MLEHPNSIEEIKFKFINMEIQVFIHIMWDCCDKVKSLNNLEVSKKKTTHEITKSGRNNCHKEHFPI